MASMPIDSGPTTSNRGLSPTNRQQSGWAPNCSNNVCRKTCFASFLHPTSLQNEDYIGELPQAQTFDLLPPEPSGAVSGRVRYYRHLEIPRPRLLESGDGVIVKSPSGEDRFRERPAQILHQFTVSRLNLEDAGKPLLEGSHSMVQGFVVFLSNSLPHGLWGHVEEVSLQEFFVYPVDGLAEDLWELGSLEVAGQCPAEVEGDCVLQGPSSTQFW